ncbi:hypothetical protein RBH29_17355 [Herbivorax sp. ANBcel31]|uniref:hypothetical protein n=1 Tax=Herbivorax sp. ANBcel31 TaxID=3069754 RepID=UPI0027B0D5BD|nr:hypothetical protein [Herbivorax sp. ANBcel31]MDQ2088193.1 hypothetical protein [Herbivorax sp. ANBcel31]
MKRSIKILVIFVTLILLLSCSSKESIIENDKNTSTDNKKHDLNEIENDDESLSTNGQIHNLNEEDNHKNNIEKDNIEQTKITISTLLQKKVSGVRANVYDLHGSINPDTIIKSFPDKNADQYYKRNFFMVEVGVHKDDIFLVWNTYLVRDDYTQVLVWDETGHFIEVWRETEHVLTLGRHEIGKTEFDGNEILGLFRTGFVLENHIYKYIEKDNKVFVYGETGYTIVDTENNTVKHLILDFYSPARVHLHLLHYDDNYIRIREFSEFTDTEQKVLKSIKVPNKERVNPPILMVEDISPFSKYWHD